MKVIVYYPKNPKDILVLQKKVAAVHAEAVLRHIDKLPCPKKQKLKLLDAVIRHLFDCISIKRI